VHSSTGFCYAEIVPKWEIGGFMVCNLRPKSQNQLLKCRGTKNLVCADGHRYGGENQSQAQCPLPTGIFHETTWGFFSQRTASERQGASVWRSGNIQCPEGFDFPICNLKTKTSALSQSPAFPLRFAL
jgi:hypothetical protein